MRGGPLSRYPVTRYVYRPISTRLAALLAITPISPLSVTWIAAGIALAGAGLLAAGLYIPGALLTFVSVIADCADGDLARATRRSSNVGAFLDSVLDRWTDAALILGLAYSDLDSYGAIAGLALTGSLLTSYTRARAQSLGVDCPDGIGARDSRILILVLAALIGIIWWGLLIVAITGFATSIQRGLIAARQLQRVGEPTDEIYE